MPLENDKGMNALLLQRCRLIDQHARLLAHARELEAVAKRDVEQTRKILQRLVNKLDSLTEIIDQETKIQAQFANK